MSNTNGNSKVNPGSNASSNAPSTNNNVPSGAKKGSFNVKEFIKSPTFHLGILLAVTGIVILTLFWYQYREWKKTQDDYQKKRIANVCPDYWHNVSDGENKTSFNSILKFYVLNGKIVWVNQFNQSVINE